MRNGAAALVILTLTALTLQGCDYTTDSGAQATPGTIQVNSENGSGVTGTVTIDDQPGNAANVAVSLSNMPAGAHAGEAHLGSCGNNASASFPLNAITPDATGNGTATTTNVPDQFLSAGYAIEYHASLNPPGVPIACAEISPAGPGGGTMY